MKSKGIIVLLFVAAAVALVYRVLKSGTGSPGPAPVATGAAPDARGAPAGPRTSISVVFGTEKEAWLRAAVADYQKMHPEQEIELLPKGSLEAAQEIVDGKLRPTVFSPADSLVLSLLDAD